jgi:hypothetical protein
VTPPIADEVGQTARAIVGVMKDSPLLLSLVIINFALVAFMFYTNNQVLSQRQDALTRIVDWQQRTDSLMASCVSIDVMKLVVDALERDRSLYRQMLPPLTPIPPLLSIPPLPPPAPDPGASSPRSPPP